MAAAPVSWLLPLAAVPAAAWNPWLTGLLVVLALLAVGFAVLWFWPLLAIRAMIWLATHVVYHIKVLGKEKVPRTGGALIVCNHVSFIDWLLLSAALPRPARFLVFAGYARHWLFSRVLTAARAIPVDGSAGPRAIVQALRKAAEYLKQGELVCIFAEGSLTRTGFMLPFHRGFEQILKHSPAPVVPACLDQVWGSIFSYYGGRVFWKWPLEFPYSVTVAFGEPMPPTSSAADVRLVIQKLSADCAVERGKTIRPPHRQFVRIAARHTFRPCLINPEDKDRPLLNYGKTFAAAAALSTALKPLLGDDRVVGLWLPPSVGGAITNIAVAFLGRTTVNLNYTSSAASIQSAVRQTGLRRVLTSRRFLERMKLELEGVELIPLEDVRPKITKGQLLKHYLAAVLLPGWVLEHWWTGLGGHRPQDLATIIFSSGSTGEPKGVMLTHSNIASNARSMIQAIHLSTSDRLLGVLPFFHSFGYTVTIWVPLQIGASIVYHADPRQAKEIGELCQKYGCTVFVTTPTFLRFCLRRCEPDNFRSMRFLICGAEKLPQNLAKEFREKFGVLPLEGYGCTELSPVVGSNVPDVEVNGLKQVGNKPGTIGQPFPGIAARVVDADTFEVLSPGKDGLLLIYGPNVMKGYLGLEQKTREVIRDGWYVTGDVARIDEDGFVTLTGRLTRFAKVGGEMVPLERIEEELHSVLGTTEKVCAVTAVPDEKKGERIVVLHLPLQNTDARTLSQQLTTRGLPNLGLPGERDFFEVPEIPVLGAGKLDLKGVRDLALQRVRGNGQ